MTSRQDNKDCSGPVMASVVRLFGIWMFFHFAEPNVCGSDDLLENGSVWTTRVSWIGETTIDSLAFLHVLLVTQVASTFDQFDPMSFFLDFRLIFTSLQSRSVVCNHA